MKPLTSAEITAAVKNLPYWDVDGNELVTEFQFENFLQSMEFVNGVAAIAEQRQHHPELTIQYDTVVVVLSTHDAGNKISDKDIAMAHAIEDMVDTSDIFSRFE